MEFGNIKDLYFIIIPLIICIFTVIGGNKRSKILRSIGWYSENKLIILKAILIVSGSLLVFLALLSPQKLKGKTNMEIKGNDLYVLMDISKSMLSKDVYPNRLNASKRELKDILTKLKGDRVGIIPFSDSAYIQMPLTDDYFMANNYIDAIDSSLISGGGTKLLTGIELANKSFEKTQSKNKNIIIFTDGGEDNSNIIDYVKKNKIKVFIFGVGTDEGSVIPIKDGFIKDKNGQIVVSKLNDKFLKKLSQESGGDYYSLNNTQINSSKFIRDLDKLEKDHKRSNEVKIYTKYYQYPLSLGILLILIGYLLRKKRKEESYV